MEDAGCESFACQRGARTLLAQAKKDYKVCGEAKEYSEWTIYSQRF